MNPFPRKYCRQGHELAVVGFYWRKNGKGRDGKPKRQAVCLKCKADAAIARDNGWRATIGAAIAAYQQGEPALSIQARLHVPNQTLYRHLDKQGIPRQCHRNIIELPQYRCAWHECEALLPRGDGRKFCCRTHYVLWMQEDARKHRVAA